MNGFADGFRTCVFLTGGAVVPVVPVDVLVLFEAADCGNDDDDTATLVLPDGGVVLSEGVEHVFEAEAGVATDVSDLVSGVCCCCCCCWGGVVLSTTGGVVCCCMD